MRLRWPAAVVFVAAVVAAALTARGCVDEQTAKAPPTTSEPVLPVDEPPVERAHIDVPEAPPFEAIDADGRCTLVVRVIDIDGEPAAGVPVFVSSREGDVPPGESDADGRLVVSDLSSGVVVVTVDPRVAHWGFDIARRTVHLPRARDCVLVSPEFAVLRGRVVDPEGYPVVGARVATATFPARGVVNGSIPVGDDGVYELAYDPNDVSVKDYLVVGAPGYRTITGDAPPEIATGMEARRDFVLTPDLPARTAVGDADEQADDDYAGMFRTDEKRDADAWDREYAEKSEGRALRGRIVDPMGRPVPGALVAVEYDSMQTGADGTFVLTAHGWERLTAWAPHHHMREFDVHDDVDVLEDIVLLPRLDVRVRLLFDDDGSPVIGAMAYLHDVRAATDEDGVAVLRGVWPAELDEDEPLHVSPGRADLPQPVQAWYGPIATDHLVELRVARGRAVSGNVLDVDGTPFVGAAVWLDDDDLWQPGVWTDLDGRFVVPGLPRDRAVRVVASHDAYEHAWLTPPTGPTEEDIDVTLRFPAQATTSGRVRAPDDYGYGEIEVVAIPLEPFPEHVEPMERSAEVDGEGRFALDTMKSQRYRLILRRNPLFARRLGPVDEVVGGAGNLVLDATLGADIRGKVVDRWGPLARAKLRLQNVSDDLDIAWTTTLESGSFWIEGLEPGATYNVRYKKSEHAPEWLDLPPLAAGTHDVLLELP